MQIGCLGDIAFEVSSKKTKTISNMQWSGSARYGSHQLHLSDTLLEFTGLDTDKISFDVVLSAYLGADPISEVDKIWQYERDGKTLPLVIGNKSYGKYRWVINDHKLKAQYFDAVGNVSVAVVTLNLLAYVKS